MKIPIIEYHEDRYTLEPKPYCSYIVEGDNEEDCFKMIYCKYVRPLRYCNGWYIICADTDVNRRFIEWRKNNVTIQMFYGNGTVD